jgi:uncharacterized protein YbcI
MKLLKKIIRTWQKDHFGLQTIQVFIDILISMLIILHLLHLLHLQALQV